MVLRNSRIPAELQIILARGHTTTAATEITQQFDDDAEDPTGPDVPAAAKEGNSKDKTAATEETSSFARSSELAAIKGQGIGS